MPSPWRYLLKALSADPAVVESIQNRTANFIQPLGGTNVSQSMRAAIQRAQAATYAWMYANQPAVRTCVDMVAVNTSQLGLKLYERVSDTERESVYDHPASKTMRYPNDATPADLFIAEYVSDYLVYNNAYALKVVGGPENPVGLIRLLPHMVAVLGQGYAVTGYRVFRTDGSFRDFPPDQMMHWRNYNPQDPRLGISPLETLRATLVQESATMAVLTELAQSGLQGGYIKRPAEVDPLSVEAEQRFIEMWTNARKASPRKTPILQEGMEWIQTTMAPKDAEMLDSRKFSREEVATLFGIPIGLLTGEGDQENQLKRFYTDVVAPLSKRLSCQLDLSLLQMVYADTDLYFEFNMDEKLRGNPESRYPALTATIGRPWRTVNEGRAMENLSAIEGGDELTIPTNVQLMNENGELINPNPNTPQLPAPNVMPPQDPNKPPQDGSYREEPQNRSLNGHDKAQHLIPRRVGLAARRNDDGTVYTRIYRRHFERQENHLKNEGVKKLLEPRWDKELADDLLLASRSTVAREGAIAAARMASEFDDVRTFAWQEAKARDTAEKVNAYTAERVSELGLADAFAEARSTRAVQGGLTYATGLFAFAAKEALDKVPDRELRTVTISGGDCEICAPFQGTFRFDEVEGWPPYHTNCNCIADTG